MKLHGSYWAELSAQDNVLVTAGVLVAGKRKILFRAFRQFNWLEAEMKNSLADMSARGFASEEILDYYAERSNGITVSVSQPETVEGDSLSDAADRMLERSKHYA